eukprot:57244-Rhodomonas_salina.1
MIIGRVPVQVLFVLESEESSARSTPGLGLAARPDSDPTPDSTSNNQTATDSDEVLIPTDTPIPVVILEHAAGMAAKARAGQMATLELKSGLSLCASVAEFVHSILPQKLLVDESERDGGGNETEETDHAQSSAPTSPEHGPATPSTAHSTQINGRAFTRAH